MDDFSTAPLPDGTSRTHAAILPAGYILSGRYRIVRLAGQGGMGQVYEAEDLELGEPVALKVIHPGFSTDDRTVDRFKREIQLARKVTHPNVCRIFDLGYHAPDATSGRFVFLTMELLAGETLLERLRRTGPMTAAEALPLIEQMAAALQCAHEAGIVHRDFKSGNVMLVPVPGGGCRAVVTDFGLACVRTEEGNPIESLSASGALIGTPAYMAPEQVKGDEVGTASDIYALGMVMYEMATGVLPFAGGSPFYTAIRRLKEAPEPPRAHVPDLDQDWNTVILRCLELEPADRFHNASDVVKALRREEGAPAPAKSQRRAIRARRMRLAWGGAILLVLLLAALYYFGHARASWRLAHGTGARPSVAVLGFRNLSGLPETAWLSTALSEMLTTELAAGGKLRAIPGENVARMRIELAVADTSGLARNTLERIRRNVGSDLVVSGSYTGLGARAGGRIRLDLRVEDTVTGELIASIAETGTEADLFDLVARAGAALRGTLGIGDVTREEAGTVHAALPSATKATRLYAEGLERLRAFDMLAALRALEQAVEEEPNYPLAHSALATVWSSLGYETRAAREARKAFDLSSSISRPDRLAVEALYRQANKEWDKAVEIYRTLFAFFPDDLEYGLRLAGAQTAAGKGKDALATVDALRRLPAPSGDDPRIGLQEAGAAHSQSDYRRALAAARKAADAGEARGAKLLSATARLAEAAAMRRLGDLKGAIAAAGDARAMFDAAGDRFGAADALNTIANSVADQGDYPGARRLYEEALRVHRDLGNKSGIAASLDNIANLLVDQGEPGAARRLSEQALSLYTEVDQKNGIADTLNNIAGELSLEGDLASAKVYFEKSLVMRREIGDRAGVATALNNIADMESQQGEIEAAKKDYAASLKIFRETGQKASSAYPLIGLGLALLAAGDLAVAKSTFEEGVALCRETGDQHELAYAVSGLAEVDFRRGDLEAAKRRHSEALGIRNGIGEKGNAAASQLGVAAAALEQGNFREAEAAAREAAAEFQREKLIDSELAARTVLAAALAQEGRTADSRREIARASGLVAKTQNRSARLGLAILSARLQPDRAKLETALDEASRASLAQEAFDARLALGELDLQSGQGRARLDELAHHARARGFLLVARKAARTAR